MCSARYTFKRFFLPVSLIRKKCCRLYLFPAINKKQSIVTCYKWTEIMFKIYWNSMAHTRARIPRKYAHPYNTLFSSWFAFCSFRYKQRMRLLSPYASSILSHVPLPPMHYCHYQPFVVSQCFLYFYFLRVLLLLVYVWVHVTDNTYKTEKKNFIRR